VRELNGVMAANGATGGFVVTSGEFTQDAIGFARGRNIELINGENLTAMIRGAQTMLAHVETNTIDVPNCPKCGKPMVKRIAKRGPNIGNSFWGCSTFPRCNGMRQIA